MPDTNLQTSDATVILSEANDLSPSEIPAHDDMSEVNDLQPVEAATHEDTLELDLALEEELIIEDFSIDGICGVY